MRRGLPLLALGLLAALTGCERDTSPSSEALAAYSGRAKAGAQPAAAEPSAPTPAPGIELTVVSGRAIADWDDGPGESDPYVIVDYDGTRHETSEVDGEVEPVWGDTFVLETRAQAPIVLTLMDSDAWSTDEKMGVATVELPALPLGQEKTWEVPIRGGEAGYVTLKARGVEIRP